MRSLSPEQFELITAAVNESLSQYSAGALEKDIHLTEVLRVLKSVEQRDLALVFCGGTSLVKAYGYLNRMSEDVDLKIVGSTNLGRSALRQTLSQFKSILAQVFADSGFEVKKVQALNENHYFCFELSYQSKFPIEVSLRPEIKVEFTYASTHLPVSPRLISTLLNRDLDRNEDRFEFTCNAMEETMAEKIVGFLRRFDKLNHDQEVDERLVRHIHDVHVLKDKVTDFQLVRRAFALAVREDSDRFVNQDAEFSQNPKLSLRSALNLASLDLKLEDAYARFVMDLVAGDAPNFNSAFASFAELAEELIESLD